MIKSAYTTEKNIVSAVANIKEQLSASAALIIYFASSEYDPIELSKAFKTAFGNIPQIGCTTSGELVSGKMLDNSITAMSLSSEEIGEVNIQVAQKIKEDPEAIARAFYGFEQALGTSMIGLDHEKYVGLVLTDGLSGCEEKVMDSIGNLTNISFIGGSAGDDLKFTKTHVFANGQAFSNASVMAVFKSKAPFSILKTQSFKTTKNILKVTESDPDQRKVITFNNKPATVAYAEALGVEERTLADHIFKNPVGLVADGSEIFVRSPRAIEGNEMFFYCSMIDGMELSLLNSTDIIEDTRNALVNKENELGAISGIINFNCILRTLDLKGQNKTDAYGELFAKYPTIGFSTYGESYIGHINQTATMLVFGKS
jgi:hypothetical protein